MKPPRFTYEDANRAYDEWGANCGPTAIAAIMGLTLDELRPHMGDFEKKHYTNPTLMWSVLRNLGAEWRLVDNADVMGVKTWPKHGLARVQWEGPWTEPGVPMKARYRHTHWIAAIRSQTNGIGIFDINAMAPDHTGWVAEVGWVDVIAPWIMREIVPKSNGRWHLTHVVEVEPNDA